MSTCQESMEPSPSPLPQDEESERNKVSHSSDNLFLCSLEEETCGSSRSKNPSIEVSSEMLTESSGAGERFTSSRPAAVGSSPSPPSEQKHNEVVSGTAVFEGGIDINSTNKNDRILTGSHSDNFSKDTAATSPEKQETDGEKVEETSVSSPRLSNGESSPRQRAGTTRRSLQGSSPSFHLQWCSCSKFNPNLRLGGKTCKKCNRQKKPSVEPDDGGATTASGTPETKRPQAQTKSLSSIAPECSTEGAAVGQALQFLERAKVLSDKLLQVQKARQAKAEEAASEKQKDTSQISWSTNRKFWNRCRELHEDPVAAAAAFKLRQEQRARKLRSASSSVGGGGSHVVVRSRAGGRSPKRKGGKSSSPSSKHKQKEEPAEQTRYVGGGSAQRTVKEEALVSAAVQDVVDLVKEGARPMPATVTIEKGTRNRNQRSGGRTTQQAVPSRRKRQEPPPQGLLVAAVRKGQLELVKPLVEAGEDVNQQEMLPRSTTADWHQQPVATASSNPPDSAERCDKKDEKEPDGEDKHPSLMTPLHIAAEMGEAGIVKILLQLGARVNIRDSKSETALHSATKAPNATRIMDLLVHEGGADIGCATETTPIWRPIHLASMRSGAATRALIRLGARVDPKDEAGLTPLHCSATTGKIEALHALIAAGADPETKDSFLRTPFIIACRYGQTGLAKSLIVEYHVNPIAQNDEGDTGLHVAARFQQLECYQALVQVFSSAGGHRQHQQHHPLLALNRREGLSPADLLQDTLRRESKRKKRSGHGRSRSKSSSRSGAKGRAGSLKNYKY